MNMPPPSPNARPPAEHRMRRRYRALSAALIVGVHAAILVALWRVLPYQPPPPEPEAVIVTLGAAVAETRTANPASTAADPGRDLSSGRQGRGQRRAQSRSAPTPRSDAGAPGRAC